MEKEFFLDICQLEEGLVTSSQPLYFILLQIESNLCFWIYVYFVDDVINWFIFSNNGCIYKQNVSKYTKLFSVNENLKSIINLVSSKRRLLVGFKSRFTWYMLGYFETSVRFHVYRFLPMVKSQPEVKWNFPKF